MIDLIPTGQIDWWKWDMCMVFSQNGLYWQPIIVANNVTQYPKVGKSNMNPGEYVETKPYA